MWEAVVRIRPPTSRVLVGVLLVLASLTVPASGHDIYKTYPGRGYVWLNDFYDYAEIWVVSEMCNQSELAAYDRVTASTAGTIEFADAWPSGIVMRQMRCDGFVTESDDILLDYQPLDVWTQTHTSSVGGENHDVQAPPEWCAMWGASHPCGTHWATVHLNLEKWNATSLTGRERLIMHETGHSLGLAHHCSSDSIMNDGGSSCNGGRWLQVMAYQATDRQGIKSMYPNRNIRGFCVGGLCVV